MGNIVITKHDDTKVKVVSEVNFEFKGLTLPAMVDENHDFWFLLKDVGDFLDVSKSNRKDLLNSLEPFEKAGSDLIMTSSNGTMQKRKTTLISESGFYNVVLRSRKKKVKDFQVWVRCEVLPSIRKYGIAIYKEQLEKLKPKDLIEVLKQLEPNAEVRYEGETAYICAKDIKGKLGLKSTNAITYRLREGEHFKKFNRIIFVNSMGLKIVIERSRKPEASLIAQLANMEVVKEVPEATVHSEIMKAFGDKFKISDQTSFEFEGKTCKVDLFFPELNLGFEVDEDGHKDRDPKYEKRRQEHMEKVLGWTIIRVNPHDPTFTPGEAVRQVFNFIYDNLMQ
jgi:prophage antirepressor-like protein/very-short-patch-repair endonuclease